jgi:hypothetical protein
MVETEEDSFLETMFTILEQERTVSDEVQREFDAACHALA